MSKIEALKLAISRTKHGVMRINDVVRDVNAAWVEAGEPYPLPVGEYKRRAWLLADLERMLTQLVDEAHAEALEMNMDFDEARYSAEHAQEQFKEIDPEVRGEVIAAAHAEALELNEDFDCRASARSFKAATIEACHTEALEMNAETDRRRHCSVMASLQNTIMERDDLPELVEACHAEALEEDKRYTWLANRWGLFWAGCDFFTRRTMIEEAHTEAIAINHKKNAMQNAGKAGAVYAFHDEIVGKHNTVWEALEEWEDMHFQALKINVLIDHILYKRKHDRRWRTKYLLTWQISILMDEDDSYVTDEYLLAWKIALRVEKITASNLETVLAP